MSSTQNRIDVQACPPPSGVVLERDSEGKLRVAGRGAYTGFGTSIPCAAKLSLTGGFSSKGKFKPHDNAAVRHAVMSNEYSICQRLYSQQSSNPSSMQHIISILALSNTSVSTWIISEWADGGTLDGYFSKLCEKKRWISEVGVEEFALKIFTAISNLHNIGIFNGDIKLDNVLLRDSRSLGAGIALTDFGLGRLLVNAPPASPLIPLGLMEELMVAHPATDGEGLKKVDTWKGGWLVLSLLGRNIFWMDYAWDGPASGMAQRRRDFF
ncbi:Pkinase-domain-containing protein, partial [Pseudohyphozyma bogoriensis]